MGEDSRGIRYSSVNALWEEELGIDGKGRDSWYKTTLDYWSNSKASVDGVLAGNAIVSPADLEASSRFLNLIASFSPSRHGGSCGFETVLDCGAGIGRVTRGCLAKHFKTCDLLEPVPHLLKEAENCLRREIPSRVDRFICSGIEQFVPESGRYDCIWFQWCVLYLPDPDLVECLRRYRACLKPNGILVVKENVILGSSDFQVDRDDNSIMRTDAHYRRLFKEAGLTVILEMRQPYFPRNLIPVMMYCLR